MNDVAEHVVGLRSIGEKLQNVTAHMSATDAQLGEAIRLFQEARDHAVLGTALAQRTLDERAARRQIISGTQGVTP